jgi:hypothetical protein
LQSLCQWFVFPPFPPEDFEVACFSVHIGTKLGILTLSHRIVYGNHTTVDYFIAIPYELEHLYIEVARKALAPVVVVVFVSGSS